MRDLRREVRRSEIASRPVPPVVEPVEGTFSVLYTDPPWRWAAVDGLGLREVAEGHMARFDGAGS